MKTTQLAVVFTVALALTACKDQPAPTPPAAPGATGVAGLPPLPSGEITGNIQVAPPVADKVKIGEVIYLVARNAATGKAVAVAKLAAPEKFPLPFTLTEANVMSHGAGLAGKLRLEARVDKDGDAMSKNPGDIIGEVAELVTVPSKNVVVTLNKVL